MTTETSGLYCTNLDCLDNVPEQERALFIEDGLCADCRRDDALRRVKFLGICEACRCYAVCVAATSQGPILCEGCLEASDGDNA